MVRTKKTTSDVKSANLIHIIELFTPFDSQITRQFAV